MTMTPGLWLVKPLGPPHSPLLTQFGFGLQLDLSFDIFPSHPTDSDLALINACFLVTNSATHVVRAAIPVAASLFEQTDTATEAAPGSPLS